MTALGTDVLDYIDQATFLSWRATGRAQLIQVVFLYPDRIDTAGLERFRHSLARGRGSRLIEPSVLPFGRHRWVRAPSPGSSVEIADVRSPSELAAWVEERSQVPVDPVTGPGWHLSVLPMTDGSTAVSLVMSHCLMDGGAGLCAVADAVGGVERDFGYGPPRARRRWAALKADARQTARDVPETARTVLTAARYAYARRGEITSARGRARAVATAPVDVDRPVVLPAVSVFVDTEDWDRRADDLGGTPYTLMAGFSAALGARLGRTRESDGKVSLLIAISERSGLDDQRANAMRIASAAVDPVTAPSDLTPTRNAIRVALRDLSEDAKHDLLPITPFVPKRAVRGTADVVFGDLPVACSNVGDIPAELARVDGRPPELVLFRPVDQGVTLGSIERSGGQLVIGSGRVLGKVSIGVVAYQVGAENTRAWLGDQAAAVLEQFGLKGAIV